MTLPCISVPSPSDHICMTLFPDGDIFLKLLTFASKGRGEPTKPSRGLPDVTSSSGSSYDAVVVSWLIYVDVSRFASVFVCAETLPPLLVVAVDPTFRLALVEPVPLLGIVDCIAVVGNPGVDGAAIQEPDVL